MKITPGRDHGMTWKYRIGVLAPDGVTYRTRTVTVTYLTEATHRAGLTGLSVDGRDVAGFSPDRLEYTVGVANPDRYVVTPSWDKQTGMSVTKHVDGADTTLTVTSADGADVRRLQGARRIRCGARRHRRGRDGRDHDRRGRRPGGRRRMVRVPA